MKTYSFWSRTHTFTLLTCTLLAGAPAWAQDDTGDTGFPLTHDQEMVRIAEDLPGFGGLFLDGERTHVYLTDLSLSDRAQALAEGGVEVHKGDYDVRDLAAWKAELRPLLAQPGAVLLDLDERSNRLRLRVEKGSERAMESALREVRVPRAAVILEVGDPFQPLELLTDRIRPVPGGVRIRNAGGGGCTLGFHAVRSGVRGFVTNSHCSSNRGVVDGTVFFQRSTVANDRVGVEIADPALFFGGDCPIGRLCRYSDASFVDWDMDSLSAGLEIANPLMCGTSMAAPLTVNPANPRVDITGQLFGSPASGSVVHKVGATTGCTFGSVQSTCADTNSNGSPVTMLCQTIVGAKADFGDSGSPVFLHGGDEATLVGILWGGGAGNYVYSPWLFVHAELGGLALIE